MGDKVISGIANEIEVKQAIINFLKLESFKTIVKYIIIKLHTKFKFRYNNSIGLGKITIEDIIQNVFFSFLSVNGRNWNKVKFPDFKDQFYSGLDSEIYNSFNKEVPYLINKTPLKEDTKFDEQVNFDNDQQLEYVEKQLQLLGATDEEILIFEPYMVHGMKRNDIAELLDVSPQHITNLQKKLHRKLVIISNNWKKNNVN